MQIRIHHDLTELEPLRDDWNRLAGDCPFRQWTWQSTWWRHYGAGRRRRRLYVASAQGDDGALLAILPCYWSHSIVRGRTLRLIGDGEVCSEHLGLLANSTNAENAADAIAQHLIETPNWDLVHFEAVEAHDSATERLLDALGRFRCHVTQAPGDRTWAIDLPADWETFLAIQSKSHRKQIRQLQRRVLEGSRAQWRLVENADSFNAAWPILIDLHQRRRRSLGEPGCFASPTWAAFHRDVARLLLDEGRLRLSWLELDGAPIAAEYHLAGARTTYAYQGGLDPDRLADEPGQLSTICSIRQALAEGHAKFDLLRGDEPYKAHWRASPRPVARRQAAAPRRWPALRKRAYDNALRVAQFVHSAGEQIGRRLAPKPC